MRLLLLLPSSRVALPELPTRGRTGGVLLLVPSSGEREARGEEEEEKEEEEERDEDIFLTEIATCYLLAT